MTILADLSQADLLAQIEQLKAENDRLQAARQAQAASRLSCKVSEKGAVSVYGMGRWPVTLYRSQWERLFAAKELIEAFITANRDSLSEKD